MLLFYMKEFQEADENLGYVIVVDPIDDVFQQKSTDQNCKRGDQYCLQKQADLQFPVFTFLKFFNLLFNLVSHSPDRLDEI